MSYYDNQESVANIAVGLMERGWNIFGYHADESDPMTDYFSPAYWEGVAEKDGYVLLVDVYGNNKSGHKVTKQGYTVDHSKIAKLQATVNDSAATDNEKATAQKAIERMKNKEKESTIIVEEYPTFTQGNPKRCNWHIEKDGILIAKGNGAFKCDGYLFGDYEKETMKKVNKFIDRIESFVNSGEQLEKVVKKTVKKVVKPVEVKTEVNDFIKDQTIIKLNAIFTGGHSKGTLLQLVEVSDFNDKARMTFVRLGKKYQQLKRYGAANNTLVLGVENLKKWVAEGSILTMELQEVEEVRETVTYKKAKRKASEKPIQDDNLLQGETLQEEQETPVETNLNDNEGITYKLNEEKNGVEIYFTEKPSEEVREQLKANSFRWSKYNKCWYAKQSEETISLAKQLAGEQEEESSYINQLTEAQKETLNKRLQKEHVKPLRLFINKNNSIILECLNLNIEENKREPFYFLIQELGSEHGKGYDYKQYLNELTLIHTFNNVTKQPVNYPEINIDDCDQYTIDQSLQDREHDANWIFRQKKRDHNKEIQSYFAQLTNEVKEIINTTDNDYIIYRLKKTLQYFKKYYFKNYVARLRLRADNPSWAVTGRDGRNANKDRKVNNRLDKLMNEFIDFEKDYKNRISTLKSKIAKDKEKELKEQLQNELKQPLPDLKFKTVTKEFDLYGNGNLIKTRFYECEGYATAKVWGAFRVFEIATGKEVYSAKSNGTLKDAKAYIGLMIKKNREKEQQVV